MKLIRVGTRGSLLARTQTGQTVDALRSLHPDVQFEIVTIKTTGDARTDVSFAAVGTKGMFVKELEEALLNGSIDLAVHSLKDMPAELPAGLVLAATPKRADPRDALLSKGQSLNELPHGARVGTSSIRRQAQIRAARPDLRLLELRGNLDTRVRRLDEGQYDAIVLACAGLDRQGWSERIIERIPVEISVPAPGQGALALEIREDAAELRELLYAINDTDTSVATAAERGFQQELNAGCQVPAGACAQTEGERITLTAVIASPDGSEVLHEISSASRSGAVQLGTDVAQRLLVRGGTRFLQQIP